MRHDKYDIRLEQELSDNEGLRGTMENLDERYGQFKTAMPEGLARVMIRSGASTSGTTGAVLKHIYEKHSEDGNLVPVIVGYLAAQSLLAHILAMAAKDPVGAVCMLANDCTIPLHQALYEKVEKEALEDALGEL